MIEAKIKKDVSVAVKNSNIKTWHKKICHIGEKDLETFVRKWFLPSFAGMFLKTCLLLSWKDTKNSF